MTTLIVFIIFVPAAVFLGFFLAALLASGQVEDAYLRGWQAGRDAPVPDRLDEVFRKVEGQ